MKHPETSSFLDEVMDGLAVTDRVFHGLKQTFPLVNYLLDRIRQVPSANRILVVGPNTLLAKALQESGYSVELWQVPSGSLTGDLKSLVARWAPLDDLMDRVEAAGLFDVIVLPYILEAASEEPDAVLTRLRAGLSPGGRILVASASAGRLIYRLRAVLGRSQLQPGGPPPVSLSWPSLPVRRLLDPSSLGHWAGNAGFQITKYDLIMDRDATMPIDAMRVKDWLLAEGTHLIRSTVPGLQDCLFATLAPVDAPGSRESGGGAGAEAPPVTVIAFAAEPVRAARLLSDLEEQTYPTGRMDVVIVHPPAAEFELPAPGGGLKVALAAHDPPVGPGAANAALRQAGGTVVAFTDEWCRVPPAWVESGVAATSGWKAACTGEVLSSGEASPPILSLPGARATRNVELDRGFFPCWNSFYVRELLMQVGGFDESLEDEDGPAWGWDSEPAYRLEAAGFRVSFEETIFVFREFAHPLRPGWPAEEYRRAKQVPAGVRRMPGLRQTQLRERVFATHRTRGFLFLLLGSALAVARRRGRYLVLGFPWIKSAAGLATFWPPSRWPGSACNVGLFGVRHAIWLAGLIAGSIRSRRMVL